MIPEDELRRTDPWNQRRKDHPRRFILTYAASILQDGSATYIDLCERPRKIRPVLTHPQCGAVLCHGDFIRRVGRAYRMSAKFRPTQVFSRFSRTSAGMIRQQGLNSGFAAEFQNTAPHGVRFLKSAGRLSSGYAFRWSKVTPSSSLLRKGSEKQKPHGPEGYR